MSKIAIFPDGTRLAGQQMTFWANQSGVVTVSLNGFTSSAMYGYTPANSAVADAIITLLDAWYAGSPTIMNVTQTLGVAIFTLSPTGGAHGSTFGVTVTGQQFVAGCTVTIAGITYTTAFTDATTISFNYTGGSAAGLYDVTVTNPNGAAFVYPQSFTLS